jgi:hypothetical protein
LIFSLIQTGILQATAGSKVKFKLGKKIQFIKIDISNWRIAKIQCIYIVGLGCFISSK